eukprot:30896-Pelagomonas_calceolata.AAC.2
MHAKNKCYRAGFAPSWLPTIQALIFSRCTVSHTPRSHAPRSTASHAILAASIDALLGLPICRVGVALGGPGRPALGNTRPYGLTPHDWGFAKKKGRKGPAGAKAPCIDVLACIGMTRSM